MQPVCASWRLLTIFALFAVLIAPWPCTEVKAQDPDEAESESAPASNSEDDPPEENAEPEAIDPALPQSWADAVDWRSIGPGNMGGRISALAVYEADPSMWWAATASGGLLKTINNGVTFEHQFDDQAVVSIGDVKVSQSDPSIVWVGTGEANPRNSVSYGNGVYKSIDGGETWSHMGLEKTYQTGRIAIHPTDPNIVYVGALGRLWGPNEERGVFKTTDGGETWSKVLYFDEVTGIVELQMHPDDPNTLLAGAYQRQRGAFDTNDPEVKFGASAGIYKTTDAGKTWRRLEEGLPSVHVGRIGFDFHRKDPNVIYAVVESEMIGEMPENAPFAGLAGENADVGARITQLGDEGPAVRAGLEVGDIVIAVDDQIVHSYQDLLSAIRRHVAGENAKFVVSRDRETVEIEIEFAAIPEAEENQQNRRGGRPGGGRGNNRNPFRQFLGGQNPNLQGQQGKEEHEHGGVYLSEDGGESWKRINSVNPRPMYYSQVRVDPNDRNHVYILGTSLYRSTDGGLNFSGDGAGGNVHVDHHALWIDPRDGRHQILGNDGGIYVTYDRMANWEHHNQIAIGQFYHVTVGPKRDYRVYGGLQDNGSWGGPSRARGNRGPSNWDWISIGGGDGFVCLVDPDDADLIYFESQNGGMGRRHLTNGERARIRPGGQRNNRYRFNWRTPFILCEHNPEIYYVAGNIVFRSLDRGNELRAISPEITVTDQGSATALAQSPRDPDLLYVGTDDGALWVTRNGGHDWSALMFPEWVKPKDVVQRSEIFYSLDQEAPPPQVADADDDDDDDPPPPPINPRRQQMIDRFRDMDANGDGKIARDEVPERMAERMFDRVDTDSDGYIDEAELEAFARRAGGGRGAAGGRGQEGGRAGGGGRRPGGAAAEGAPSGERPNRGRPRRDDTDSESENEPRQVDVVSNLPDLVDHPLWVSEIVASRFEDGRAYLCLDGHRSDDDAPHLFVTEDFGSTWTSIVANLPSFGSTRTIAEDLNNPNVLYVGTEFGAWTSIDRGKSWTEFGGLPTVAVHAFALHPSAGEIVAGTHGRSLWIADVTALRQIKKETPSASAKLFKPNTAILWRSGLRTGRSRGFVGENPPNGASIHYSIGADRVREVKILIENREGEVIATMDGETSKGLHEVRWDLRRMPRQGSSPQQSRFRRFGPRLSAGDYRVVLEVDGQRQEQPITVQIDPEYPDPTWTEYEHLEEEFFQSEEEGEGDDQEEDETI